MTKYRSNFEQQVGAVLEPEGFQYEPFAVKYVVHRKYTPDFVYTLDGHYEVLVEAKGFFRDGDTHKYKSIVQSLDESQELVFLLQAPTKQVRKGGPQTMAGWCDKQNIMWFKSPHAIVEYVEGLKNADT
jgi:hypothetical protein